VVQQPALARTIWKHPRIAADSEEFYHGAMARDCRFHTAGRRIVTARKWNAIRSKTPALTERTGPRVSAIPRPPPGAQRCEHSTSRGVRHGPGRADSARSSNCWPESYRRGLMDRALFMGDPDFNEVRFAQLRTRVTPLAWRKSSDSQRPSTRRVLSGPLYSRSSIGTRLNAHSSDPAGNRPTEPIIRSFMPKGNAVA